MQIFLVSRKTLYNCFDSWEDRGILGLYHRPGQGRKPTFTPEEMEQVRLWANAYPRQLKQVLQKVKEQWGKTVSLQRIKRVLKAVQMSWHRLRRVVGGQPDPQEYIEKQAQLEEFKRLEDEGSLDLYFLDEAEFCLVPCIPYGWQPIGETIEINSQRSSRLNVLGLMQRSNNLEAYV
jgi:transposase